MIRRISPTFIPVIAFLAIFMTACSPGKDDLVGTIEAQDTQIAALSTQVAAQEKTDWSQWEAISYLSTQMPFALGWFTPVPEGAVIKPTFTPTPWMDIEYPPETRTGIPEIDRVIDAILGSDIEARIELVRFIQYPCTTADGLGGPPKCKDDEQDGTVVTTFPVSDSEGVHVRADAIEDVFDFTVRGLLAVYVVPESVYRTDYWPAGEYAVVFTSEDNGYLQAISLHISEGEIVRLAFNPGWPEYNQIWDQDDVFILPPSDLPSPPSQPAVCTPPACATDESYHCPGECPGGCGTTCATVTPNAK